MFNFIELMLIERSGLFNVNFLDKLNSYLELKVKFSVDCVQLLDELIHIILSDYHVFSHLIEPILTILIVLEKLSV
jgi:hypothetical protein